MKRNIVIERAWKEDYHKIWSIGRALKIVVITIFSISCDLSLADFEKWRIFLEEARKMVFLCWNMKKKGCHTDFKSPNSKIYLTYICLSESIVQTNCQNQTSETDTCRMRLTNLSSASFRSPEVSHFVYVPLIMPHDVFCTLDLPNILTGRTIQLQKSLGNLKKKKKEGY